MDYKRLLEEKYNLLSSIIVFRVVDLEDKIDEEDNEELLMKTGEILASLISYVGKAVDCLISKDLKVNEFVEVMNKMNREEGFIETMERDIICKIIEMVGGDLEEVEKLREW